MQRRTKVAGGAALIALTALYLGNASWLAPTPNGHPQVLAHRGVHQTFSDVGLTQSTCTARQIDPPTNPYLENTIPSLRASFAAGATVAELDVHPTTDGEFAVFHDWTLGCRTDGHGVTREHSMAQLRALDVGYGYTADGGRTFPFRGKGRGLMPTLDEVMTAFPRRQFLINIKSDDPTEVDLLLRYLKAHGRPTDRRLWVWADGRPVARLLQLAPDAIILSKQRLKRCAGEYLAIGWTRHMPAVCRHNILGVPVNLRGLYWGWPNRLLARMAAVGTPVMLGGPIGRKAPGGVTDPAQLDGLPAALPVLIMTDHIEAIGPAVRRRWPG